MSESENSFDKESITNNFLNATVSNSQGKTASFLRVALALMQKEKKSLLAILNQYFLLGETGSIHYRAELSLPNQKGLVFTENNIDLDKLGKTINFRNFLETSSQTSMMNREEIFIFFSKLLDSSKKNEIPNDPETLNKLGNKIITILHENRKNEELKDSGLMGLLMSDKTIKESIYQAALANQQVALHTLAIRKDYEVLTSAQKVDVILKHIDSKKFEKDVFPLFSNFPKALAKTVDNKTFEKILESPQFLEKLGKNEAIKIAKHHIKNHNEIINIDIKKATPLQKTVFEEINKLQMPLIQKRNQLSIQFDKLKELMNSNNNQPLNEHFGQATGLALNLADTFEKNKIPALSDLSKKFNAYLDQNPTLKQMMDTFSNKNLDLNKELDSETRNFTTFRPTT